MPRRPGPRTFAKSLGARVRALRVEDGRTQEQLAWDCELNKSYLSQVESGKRLPSLTVLRVLARLLGVEPADLLAFDLSESRLKLLDAMRRKDVSEAEASLAEWRTATQGSAAAPRTTEKSSARKR